MQFIDASNADAHLVPASVYPLWGNLSDDVKDFHLLEASNYIRANWTCADKDWIELATANMLGDNIELACARYAYANLSQFLYPAPDITQKIRSSTIKAGSVSRAVTYEEHNNSEVVSAMRNHLNPIDDIFIADGCTRKKTSVEFRSFPITRV